MCDYYAQALMHMNELICAKLSHKFAHKLSPGGIKNEISFWDKQKIRKLSPLQHNNNLELDDSELLDEETVQKYQSFIGLLQ